jgi:hypothetical protein
MRLRRQRFDQRDTGVHAADTRKAGWHDMASALEHWTSGSRMNG